MIHVISLICEIQKNGTYRWAYLQRKNRDTDVEKFMDTKVGGVGEEGGMDWEIGIDIYALLCIKQTTNENLLYVTRNSTQCSVVT